MVLLRTPNKLCRRYVDPERPNEEGPWTVPDHFRERLAGFMITSCTSP